ncbi:acetate--CoA ligase family protein [bacterium]|nr:acetate--CoA ligase family protein [bacterium]
MAEIKEILENAKSENRNLLEHEAKEILRSMGIRLPESYLAKTKDEAIEQAKKIGFPVVMKLMSPQVLHKTDAGAVAIGLKNEEEVAEVYEDFVKKFANVEIAGVLVEKMVKKGAEIIVGTKIDATFGPVILVGLGGVFVEVLKDVVFRLCPTSKQRALDALNEIKAKKLLDGFRDLPPVNKEAVAELVEKLSILAWEYRDYIKEMDINPIIANEDGVWPVDARIIL